MKDYKIKENAKLFQFSIPKTTGNPEAFSKAFMSSPIKGVKFNMVDPDTDQLSISSALVYDSDKHANSLFIMDMTDIVVGHGTLMGTIVNSTGNYVDFIEDVKSGDIDLVLINLHKSRRPKSQGIIVEELINLVGEHSDPSAHVFVVSVEQLVTINESMEKFFLKNNGQLINREPEADPE